MMTSMDQYYVITTLYAKIYCLSFKLTGKFDRWARQHQNLLLAGGTGNAKDAPYPLALRLRLMIHLRMNPHNPRLKNRHFSQPNNLNPTRVRRLNLHPQTATPNQMMTTLVHPW
jgi:hypothetical protein